ncbi:hypothetical protein [Lacipirellula parvula]|uniref:Uncharacterized protein n=1 Tax=Lacipirellula parvula TaxID=2650471 RepID=A0A5K7XA76_9BACT|nr:hypothetical protein [Lacipirellula parvula]BBO33448.1 hypothetical protein PLANPX_3060 [Lacipirellula parvula]
MSGIGSVGANSNLFSYLTAKGDETSKYETSIDELAAATTERQQRVETQLVESLTEAGVSDETIESLKLALRTAIDEERAAGNFPPDPGKMKQTVDALFEKYGLEAGEFLGRTGAKPGSGAGLSGKGQSAQAAPDVQETLLDLLGKQASSGASSEDLAQIYLDALTGLDKQA